MPSGPSKKLPGIWNYCFANDSESKISDSYPRALPWAGIRERLRRGHSGAQTFTLHSLYPFQRYPVWYTLRRKLSTLVKEMFT